MNFSTTEKLLLLERLRFRYVERNYYEVRDVEGGVKRVREQD